MITRPVFSPSGMWESRLVMRLCSEGIEGLRRLSTQPGGSADIVLFQDAKNRSKRCNPVHQP